MATEKYNHQTKNVSAPIHDVTPQWTKAQERAMVTVGPNLFRSRDGSRWFNASRNNYVLMCTTQDGTLPTFMGDWLGGQFIVLEIRSNCRYEEVKRRLL